MPDLAGKILFLEDSGEYPYRLDRMFYHLKNAGIFNELAGVVIGNTNIPRKTAKKDLTIEQILHDVFDDYGYPVVYNLPFGHCKDKITIPQGITGYLSTSDRVLSFEEPGVSD
jgi:muramoyltetrapeptide carboxypeptidase